MQGLFSIKQVVSSLKVTGETVTLSKKDFERLTQMIAMQMVVDEKWYLSQNPDVAAAVKAGDIESGAAHFRNVGFMEGRMASAPQVDKNWYLKTYPDVAAAIKAGLCKSALEHYRTTGMYEGRLGQPPIDSKSYTVRGR
jgi:hypothetical protein